MKKTSLNFKQTRKGNEFQDIIVISLKQIE